MTSEQWIEALAWMAIAGVSGFAAVELVHLVIHKRFIRSKE